MREVQYEKRSYAVDVEVCPRCGGAARIVGFVTEPAVVRRMLAHLERRGIEARAGPWTGAAETTLSHLVRRPPRRSI